MHVEPKMTPDELEAIVRAEKNAKLANRYRAVARAMRGRTAQEAAEDVCVSRRSVQEWVRRFNEGGPEALADQPRSGAPRKLDAQQEAEVVRWLERGPEDPEIPAWRGRLVRDRIEDHFNKRLSLSAAYDLLHRLGYEPLRPRPRHRKNDPEAMEAWEERAPLLSGASASSGRTSTSRSGSRTRPASDSRAR